MLIDTLASYCNKTYKYQESLGACGKNCSHDFRNCPGDCEKCLRQVHYHELHGRNDYNCKRIVNYYVCRYANKYSSEIGYALNTFECLKKFDRFNVLSIGCGPAPDLMALEKFNKSHKNVLIDYWGFDRNELWKPIHNEIIDYGENNEINSKFYYVDAIKYFKEYAYKNFNILILQYVISHFVNSNQFAQLEKFFNDLASNIVSNMLKRSIIILNDINHNEFGRDDFVKLARIIKGNGHTIKATRRYFEFNINKYKVYGTPYPSNKIIYDVPNNIKKEYCSSRDCCSSVQLLIELG